MFQRLVHFLLFQDQVLLSFIKFLAHIPQIKKFAIQMQARLPSPLFAFAGNCGKLDVLSALGPMFDQGEGYLGDFSFGTIRTRSNELMVK